MEWLDSIIHTDLQNLNTELQLYGLVNAYKIYGFSKTCRKYKNGR